MDIAKCRTIVRAHNSLLRRFGSIVLVSLCLITNANAKARDNSNGNIFTPQDEKQERPNEPLPEAIVTTKNAQPDELMSEDSDSDSETIVVPYLSDTVTLDGVLDDAAWQHAQEVTLNVVTRPFENTTPPVETVARIFENGDTIYIGFTAFDNDPSEIRALFRDRDSVWDNDLVGIKLDTFGDSRLSYQFFVNPHGIQIDSIENQMTRSESASWNAIWDSEAKITNKGYTVEIALPFRIMNFLDADGPKQWRAEFVRFYPRDNNLRISNRPVDRDNACSLCQMGNMKGFSKAKQGKNLSITPYGVTGAARSRTPASPQNWEYGNNQEVGVDINWGMTSDMLLQATINPDFSQVEADAGQLGINNPFALFFPEQRPFFVENADFFSTQYDLVYTRNIGAPDIGSKLTGRLNDHTFGLLVANDETTTFLVPGNLGSSVAQLDQGSTNLAARYRFDVSDTLSFGTIFTGRHADDYHNLVTGVDMRYQITPSDTLRVQALRSDTQYPDALSSQFCRGSCENEEDITETTLRTNKNDAFSGSTYQIDYRHEEREWYVIANRKSTQSDFRADLGFESNVDRHKTVLGGGLVWWKDNAWWNRFELGGDWDITHNDNGELIEREVQAQVELNAAYQSYFNFQWVKRDQVGLRQNGASLAIDGNTTRFTEEQFSFYFEARPNRTLYFENFIRVGDRIDLRNNRLGEQVLLEPQISLNIGEHLEASVNHEYNRINVNDEMLFTANLSDFRISYQFSAKQYIRLALIYSDIRRNTNNYLVDVDARERSMGTQLIYSYMINPLSRLFIGYGDSAFADDNTPGLFRTEQAVFMKFSYAWLY
ncbi:carbohydrate binding family 9 domain-containing protein [Alteromonas hispanica]|uniref:Uncharacterized protein n=1 Tax=Alteromonas hispanica TaxID=315421 RepID=A0A6L9MSX8_9ALTE|nr:carbohydrate binding family 9 domain-containing protein [Alteromonas hispanica]NDW21073.1 hypothetical protein [Alteromonas hispanica]